VATLTDNAIWHRYAAGTEDDYGEQSGHTFTDKPLDEIPGQSIAFAPEEVHAPEPRDGTSQRVVSEARLYLDVPIAYGARDQFTVRGVRFEVEGESLGGWENPYTGGSSGQEIRLQRITG
jgi:hypothetical protein